MCQLSVSTSTCTLSPFVLQHRWRAKLPRLFGTYDTEAKHVTARSYYACLQEIQAEGPGFNSTASFASYATADQKVFACRKRCRLLNTPSKVMVADMQTQESSLDHSPQCGPSVAAFWDSIPPRQQLQLLTFDLKLLHARAHYVVGKQQYRCCKHFLFHRTV